MMWIAVVLLAASAALHVESYGVHGRERLAHGRMLKIYLSKNCHSLVFEPAHDVGARNVYWVKGRTTSTKGHVSGTGSERRWYLDKVTYEDEGSYIQADLWDNLISTVRVVVTPRHIYEKRMLDESFYISMEGIQLYEATLVYTGEDGNVTLVRDGMIQQGNLINFGGQVKTHSYSGIEITLTNTSQGLYTLRDRKGRVVSITKMELTDHHDGNPLLALLLLLGIPAGVCCCCRKKIFKKKATMATTNQSTSDTVHLPPTGPVGPSPPYTTVPGPAGPVRPLFLVRLK
ncbi:uncharacterized protein LOC103384322 [Cynoglossus semilaevis]|uniref:Uncharacterized LOC103384322 n=1 Tax=Cynoglossus semilaevis TaxID=244447 RepID=A0A3P8WAX7_CYNSE|nr:uncharacterized protein LOC103384322 [Cynoglossus semilaevis]